MNVKSLHYSRYNRKKSILDKDCLTEYFIGPLEPKRFKSFKQHPLLYIIDIVAKCRDSWANNSISIK